MVWTEKRLGMLVVVCVGLSLVLTGGGDAFGLTASAKTFNKDTSNAALDATVSFQGNATDLPDGKTLDDVSWNWNFGDGHSSTSPNPCHEFTTGGVKTVTLTASIPGEECQTDDDTCTVNVVASLIIDVVESRPSNKISFNNRCEVKGHVMPREVSDLDGRLDWEMNKVPYADCNLKNAATGNLQWTTNWPTQNATWAEEGEALVVSLDRKDDQDSDLDTDLNDGDINAHKASIACQKFFEKDGTQNPGEGNPPNWFYYWEQTTAAIGTMTYNAAAGGGECLWDNPDYTCELGPDSSTPYRTPQVGANANTDLDGIDTYAWSARHEWQHHEQKTTWWGEDGYDADDDEDGDGVPDDLEDGFDAEEGGPYDSDEYDSYPDDGNLENDIERHCVHTQEVWGVGTANSNDWAHPGKQWPE